MVHKSPTKWERTPKQPLDPPYPAVGFTAQEKRRIFKGMVVGELENGILRYSRRAALMKYATKLGIEEFDACLLIAEAQYHSGEIDPVSFESTANLETLSRPDAWSVPVRLIFTLVVAIFADIAIIFWLFG